MPFFPHSINISIAEKNIEKMGRKSPSFVKMDSVPKKKFDSLKAILHYCMICEEAMHEILRPNACQYTPPLYFLGTNIEHVRIFKSLDISV